MVRAQKRSRDAPALESQQDDRSESVSDPIRSRSHARRLAAEAATTDGSRLGGEPSRALWAAAPRRHGSAPTVHWDEQLNLGPRCPPDTGRDGHRGWRCSCSRGYFRTERRVHGPEPSRAEQETADESREPTSRRADGLKSGPICLPSRLGLPARLAGCLLRSGAPLLNAGCRLRL